MLTLAETLADQRNLARICAERTCPPGEVLAQNAMYGYGRVLKMAAGLPLHRPLWAVVPHGVGYGAAGHWDLSAPVPTAYSFQRDKDVELSHQGRRVLIRGCSPFVYVDEMLGSPPAGARGTLFFPAHSIATVDYDFECEALADALLALPSHLHPIRICVYCVDYNKGQHRPFAERGFQVVSAGHFFDPLFPWRLRHLLSMHAVAAGNDIGSQTMYALQAGLQWLHLSTGPVVPRAKAGHEHDNEPTHPGLISAIHTLLDVGVPVRSIASACLVNDLLGVQRKLERSVLAQALLAAERRTRSVRRRTGRATSCGPTEGRPSRSPTPTPRAGSCSRMR